MDLVTAAKSIATLRKFIEEELGARLLRYDLAAAARALASLPHARNKDQIYASVLNHLESAEEKLLSDRKGTNSFVNARALLYLKAIRASIHTIQDEEGLVQERFKESIQIASVENSQGMTIRQYFETFNPATWVALFSRESVLHKEARLFAADQYWRQRGVPESELDALNSFYSDDESNEMPHF